MMSGVRTLLGMTGLWAAPVKNIEIQVCPNQLAGGEFQQEVTFHDVNDSCRDEVLESFCLDPQVDSAALHPVEFQLKFKLSPCEQTQLKFYKGHILTNIDVDKLSVMAKCAAEAVLKSLFAVGLVEYSVVTCHAVHGAKILAENFIIGAPSISVANPRSMMVHVDIDQMTLTMSFIATGFAQHAMMTHLKERYSMQEKQDEFMIRIDP